MTTRTVLVVGLIIAATLGGVLWMRGDSGQSGHSERDTHTSNASFMENLKGLIALQPNEIPGFDQARTAGDFWGGKVFLRRLDIYGVDKAAKRAYTKWKDIEAIYFLQSIQRNGRGRSAKAPCFLDVTLSIYPQRNVAQDASVLFTTSQMAQIGEAGMPEGSFTGLPLGEKSWATAPKSEGLSPYSKASDLIVWDDRVVLRITVDYPPQNPRARTLLFTEIKYPDLELAEYAARLLLARTCYVLLMQGKSLPSSPLTVNGRELEAKRTPQGILLAPLKATVQALGGQVEERLGVYRLSLNNKWWTLPLGARVILAGNQPEQQRSANAMGAHEWIAPNRQSVPLRIPILGWENEVWVDAEALGHIVGYPLGQ